MNYTDLLEVDLRKLGTAVEDWKQAVTDLQTLAHDAGTGMKATSDGARWAGVNATVTRTFVDKTAKEFGDLHAEARSIWSILDDAHTELTGLQQRAKSLDAAARKAGYLVIDRNNGTVTVSEAQCTKDGPGEKAKEMMQWYADTLTGMVAHATDIDASVTRALTASHGNDPYNAGHKTYTSLDEDMLPRAIGLADLGDKATDQQRKELARLWSSLSPQARAQLWATHKDQLLKAGVLSPTLYTGANDDGSGPYDVDSPGLKDYKILAEAKMMVDAGDFIGNQDAARNMDHYLNGSGSTLNLDVDRMLKDDPALRDVAANSISSEQQKWRQQALEAYEKSGGKPVAIPVQTSSQGYTHSDRNWFLAVGSANTNTTGTVTVVPGQDGKPQVSLDYQVNVWDRYNWDPGKSTHIGPTDVTDADMARLHRTGLAREFAMQGSGSVQHVDLTDTGSSGQLPGSADPGRDGTRQDPGRFAR